MWGVVLEYACLYRLCRYMCYALHICSVPIRVRPERLVFYIDATGRSSGKHILFVKTYIMVQKVYPSFVLVETHILMQATNRRANIVTICETGFVKFLL